MGNAVLAAEAIGSTPGRALWMMSWSCQVYLHQTDCQMRPENNCLIISSTQAETRQLVAQTGGLDDLRAEVGKNLTVALTLRFVSSTGGEVEIRKC